MGGPGGGVILPAFLITVKDIQEGWMVFKINKKKGERLHFLAHFDILFFPNVMATSIIETLTNLQIFLF